MLIKDFLELLVENDEGVYCAVVNTENYKLPSGCMIDEKIGILFQGMSNSVPINLLYRKFSKWDMFGNEFIFII